MINKINQRKEDFRTELYKKYISTFKNVISYEDDDSRRSDFEAYKRLFLPHIKHFNNNAEIIDLGCGSGYLLQFLREEGYKNLYGVDISQEQIDKLKTRNIKGDVINLFDFLETNTKQYDIVFAKDFVEHFKKEELLPLFSGMCKLLKEDGLLFIFTPNGQSPLAAQHIYGDLTHLTIFNPASLTQILLLTGFTDLKFFETGPTKKNIKGIFRLVLWRFVKFLYQAVRVIETGSKEEILTQDFMCTARKNKINQKNE